MKRKLAIFILLIWMLPVCARAADYLVPVGTLVGLQLRTDTITVAAFDEASGSAARDAGLKIGDCITAVNGTYETDDAGFRDLACNETRKVTCLFRLRHICENIFTCDFSGSTEGE